MEPIYQHFQARKRNPAFKQYPYEVIALDQEGKRIALPPELPVTFLDRHGAEMAAFLYEKFCLGLTQGEVAAYLADRLHSIVE